MADLNSSTGGAADFTGGAANRSGVAAGAGTTGAVGNDWASEQRYWRENFGRRPYATADRGFDYFEPGYRYGFESANRHSGREWTDVESDLRSGWERYEHRATSTWDNVKHAVRDAWDRVRGRGRV